jgi:hypothetical protein
VAMTTGDLGQILNERFYRDRTTTVVDAQKNEVIGHNLMGKYYFSGNVLIHRQDLALQQLRILDSSGGFLKRDALSAEDSMLAFERMNKMFIRGIGEGVQLKGYFMMTFMVRRHGFAVWCLGCLV